MRVLGVDPGLVVTGYGVLDQTGNTIRLVEGGTIDAGDAKNSLPVRLRRLHEEINALI